MRAAVQTILSRLQGLLERRSLPPVFVFAEEAHLNLGETDWLEAVTRMRHLGMYQVYLTNTPTRVPNLIVREVDNLLLFHLDLEEDARHIGPASRTGKSLFAFTFSYSCPKAVSGAGDLKICSNISARTYSTDIAESTIEVRHCSVL
jgi:hypothetical protein